MIRSALVCLALCCAPLTSWALDEPPPIEVDDPMLAPLPAPTRQLHSWSEASDLLRARSTDLRIALADVQRAEAQARIALAAALPQINATFAGTYNLLTNESAQIAGVDAQGNPQFSAIRLPIQQFGNAQASAQMPLINLRTWYAIGTANRNAEAARLTTEDAKRTLVLNLASAVVSVYTAERVAELNRIGLHNALERLELARRRQTLGATSGLDVVRSEQDVETARSTLVSGDESLRRAREALGLAVGFAEAVGIAQDIKLDTLAAGALGSCKAGNGVDARADVAAQKKRVEVAARQISDARLQFLPTLSLNSTLSTTTQDTGAFPRTLWNLQGIISIPIWDGGARYGSLRDGHAQYDQAQQRLEASRRNATVQTVQAMRGVSVAEQTLKVAEANRNLALETDRLTRASYIEGRGTSLELVATAASLRQAEINLALREFELVQARIGAALALSVCKI